MKDYIITFDLETTGRNIEKDKICWICLKKINKNTKMIEEVFNRYVNPNMTIEPDAQKVHGLSNEFLSFIRLYFGLIGWVKIILF